MGDIPWSRPVVQVLSLLGTVLGEKEDHLFRKKSYTVYPQGFPL